MGKNGGEIFPVYSIENVLQSLNTIVHGSEREMGKNGGEIFPAYSIVLQSLNTVRLRE